MKPINSSKFSIRTPLLMRKMSLFISGTFVLALAAWISGLTPARMTNLLPVEASPLRGTTPDENAQIVLIRQAGLTNDRSQAPLMMSVLSDPSHPHPSVIRTALHSLAQLGATEALPLFDIMAQNKSVDPNYLETMRQRLLAESQAASAPTGPKKAATKLSAFYHGLNFTPSQVGTATSSAASQVGGTPPQPKCWRYARLRTWPIEATMRTMLPWMVLLKSAAHQICPLH